MKIELYLQLVASLAQENGYMVLRFLAEDVGKHRDDILDSILRALSRSDH